jgi:hypothetical protein
VGLTNKITNAEKRGYVRRNCEGIIRWSYFNSKDYFDAKLLNFSEGGVYIETAYDLKPGCTIFLDMKMVPSSKINSPSHERPRLVSLGEVKWRVDLSGCGQTYCGVGVGYPFPA